MLHLREVRRKQEGRLRRISQGGNIQGREKGWKEDMKGKRKGGREKMHDYNDIGGKTEDRLGVYISINNG